MVGFIVESEQQGKDSFEKFFITTADEAARQIARAIARRRRHAYVTRRWRVIAWILHLLPDTW